MAALAWIFASLLFTHCLFVESAVFTSRLIHRFSDELRDRRNLGTAWPEERRTMEFYRMLVSSDFQRQKMKLGSRHQLLFPSEGSKVMSFGNDWAWLHYTWIDIGTPNVSFLVALDAGSDLLWVPCDCIQCAPLSASYYTVLDRDMNEYSPSSSSTSKHLTCSHQLCDLGSNCESPKQLCPYNIDYSSENTSSSGLLVVDTLHLASASDDTSNTSVQAPVVIGCAMKQSGSYLEGAAPDGLMGLGPGEISVPSFLSRAGFVRNSFSMCFNDDNSGRIFFGDQGAATQQSTPFLLSDGKFTSYMVGVSACCVGNYCLKQTSFKAQVDSGTSFTFLPDDIFEAVAKEFDRRVNVSRYEYEQSPFKYCYKSRSRELPKVPCLKFMFSTNNSFVVQAPLVVVVYGEEEIEFCLGLQGVDSDTGTIGQNFMTGYRLVFDRENVSFGWSRSNCQDLSDSKRLPLTGPNGSSTNPLPTNEQQSSYGGHAIAPAVAGRAPSNKPSAAASAYRISYRGYVLRALSILLLFHRHVSVS